MLYALLLLSYFSFPNDCIWGCLKNCLIYLLSAELGLVAVPSPGTASGRCSLAGEHRLLVAVVPCWRGHAGFSSRSCRVSCSTSRGVFPHKASDLCALHLQADSSPLGHEASPWILRLSLDNLLLKSEIVYLCVTSAFSF